MVPRDFNVFGISSVPRRHPGLDQITWETAKLARVRQLADRCHQLGYVDRRDYEFALPLVYSTFWGATVNSTLIPGSFIRAILIRPGHSVVREQTARV
jgi:hypothetical protein